jgi:hypothetical protein
VTPEVETILNRIGWEIVQRSSPLMAFFLARTFQTPNPSSLTPTDASSRLLADRVHSMGQAAAQLVSGLSGLPEAVRLNIAFLSHPFPAFPDAEEALGHLEKFRAVLTKLADCLEVTEARLRYEGGPTRPGNPKNLVPHAVAFAAAKIYVVGMGSMPAAHNITAGSEARGLFGEVLDALFDAMGLGFNAMGPAQEAIAKLEELSEEDWAGLMLVRCPLTRSSVKALLVQAF